MMVPDGNILVGTLIGDEELQRGSLVEVFDPGLLDDQVGSVVNSSSSIVDAVVSVAARAQKSWAKLSVEERASLIFRAATELRENREALAPLMTRENGSILQVTRNEVMMAAQALENAATFGLEILSQSEQFSDDTSWVRVESRPYGVVACIVPWNAPVILTAQKIGPALIAGNSVVVKPSPFAPLAVSLILRHFASFFPPGVVNIIHGGGEVGAELISNLKVRMVSFTGGNQTARSIMQSAAETLTEVHFELGGNDPAIVLDDSDIELTVDNILAATFRRAGQVCFAIKRVYIPKSMSEDFYEITLAKLAEIAVGHGLDSKTDMGPVSNTVQFNKLSTLYERIKESGADLRAGGRKLSSDEWNNGYYLQPSVILGSKPDAEIVMTEQFGPILPIVEYDTEDEAIEMANSTEFGLGASVWSADTERAVAVSAKIEAGMTFVNGHGLTPLGQKHVPFGGVKQSGIGWENSAHGIREYLQFHSTTVHLQPRQ